jgi:hypothetical protein
LIPDAEAEPQGIRDQSQEQDRDGATNVPHPY